MYGATAARQLPSTPALLPLPTEMRSEKACDSAGASGVPRTWAIDGVYEPLGISYMETLTGSSRSVVHTRAIERCSSPSRDKGEKAPIDLG